MAGGFIDFVEFAATAVLAAPVGLLGLIRLSDGDPVGGVAFLAVAVGMVALERYVLAPREVVARVLGGAFRRDDDADED